MRPVAEAMVERVEDQIALDIGDIVFKMLTLRGIYGREMYETWYKMTVMLQSGQSGKVILDWAE